VRLGPVDLSPGVRTESFKLQASAWKGALDPRLRAVIDLGGTRFVAGWGLYSQLPAPRELLSAEDGPRLDLERARQASMGAEQEVGPFAKVGLTFYHHELRDLVVGRENLFRFDRTSLTGGDDFGDFANEGTGEAYGAELFATYNTDRRLVWLAVSLSRATRIDRVGDAPHPAEADQPVNVTLIASEAIGRWRVGARARYVSGPALTPVVAAVYATDVGTWIPSYGEPFSARAPFFFALDLRLDRRFRMKKSSLDLYVEVQNATNHRNVEVADYTVDYRQLDPVTGLPVFPAIGVKITW
jgi:hypothetical protein